MPGRPRLRLIRAHERAPRAPRVPEPDAGVALSPAEAATMLGVTEDEVLARQRYGELPTHLSWTALADCLDGFRGAADDPARGGPDPRPAAPRPTWSGTR